VIDLPNDEICRRLAIGDGTLRNHLSNIYFKLRVSNRSGAIDKARLFGLV
jgi:DNA-binding CsgD family transcriptional regulator